jgi:periplasmic protein TonB
MTTFAPYLDAHARSPGRARRRLLLAVSVGVHVGALVALTTVARRPARIEPAIALRMVSLVRPPSASPTTTPRKARARRRLRLLQPTPAPASVEPRPTTPSQELSQEAPGPAEASGAPPSGEIAAGFGAGTSDAPFALTDVARRPSVLGQVTPTYPPEARRRGLEGLVVVRIVVGRDGLVEPAQTRVVRSVPGLDEAAIAAVARWRFSPAAGPNGQPVRVTIEIPFEFFLR